MNDFSFLVPEWQTLLDEALLPIHHRLKREPKPLDLASIQQQIENKGLPDSALEFIQALSGLLALEVPETQAKILTLAQEALSNQTGYGLKIEITKDYTDTERQTIQALEWMNFYILELGLVGLDLPAMNPDFMPYRQYRREMQRIKTNSELEILLTKRGGPYQLATSSLSILKIPQFQCFYCGELGVDGRGKAFDGQFSYCHFNTCKTHNRNSADHRHASRKEYCCYGTWDSKQRSYVRRFKNAESQAEAIAIFHTLIEEQKRRCKGLPRLRSLLTPLVEYSKLPRTIDDSLSFDDEPNMDSIA